MWSSGAGASFGNFDNGQAWQPAQSAQPSSVSQNFQAPIRGSYTSPVVPFSERAVTARTSPPGMAPRKRKRLVVSCQPCHRRKQKCDRNQPCRACVSRGTAEGCRYETADMSRERLNERVTEATGYVFPTIATTMTGATATTATMGTTTTATTITTTTAPISGYDYTFQTNAMQQQQQQQQHTPLAGPFQQDTTTWYPPQLQPLLVEAELPLQQQQQQQQQQESLASPEEEADPHKLTSTCRISMDHVLPLGSHSRTLTDRYKAQVRMLPSGVAVDRLVDLYFVKLNWQYGVLDEDVFRKQLADWYDIGGRIVADDGVPTMQQQQQQQQLSLFALTPEQRVFPALLFQVLAAALFGLAVDDAEDDRTFFESIKNPTNATVKDLALDYGDASVRMLALLGKRQMTLETVQTAFLWAAFLQDASLITESWHALGSAIQDAQEIGLHSESMDPRPHAQTTEALLLNQWEVQRRRRLWIVLMTWDLNTGAMLGRPPTTVAMGIEPALPIDCVLPKTFAERARLLVQPRGATDAPTLVTRALWAYTVAAPLRAMLALPHQGSSGQDGPRVAALHAQLLAVEASTPAPFRAADPDTQFDHWPGCQWLPAARSELAQAYAFNGIALHRPYIFLRAKSRTETLKSCLRMLSLQRAYFASPKQGRWRSALFYYLFDTLILLAAIYILFPREHPELLPEAIQYFRWSDEQFDSFSKNFCLAQSARGVLQAIYLRLRKALGFNFLETDSGGLGGLMGSAAAAAVGSAPVDALTLSNIDPSLKGDGPVVGGGVHGTARMVDAVPSGMQQAADEDEEELQPALFPDGVDWESMPPICATGDLAYNILLGVSDGSSAPCSAGAPPHAAQAAAATGQPVVVGGGGAVPWLFQGDFGNNSFWGVLNSYAYAPLSEERQAAWPV